MTWFKYDTGEIIDGGDRVLGPDFELGPNGGVGIDGWQWFDSFEQAEEHYSLTEAMILVPESALNKLIADLESTTETNTLIKLRQSLIKFAQTVRDP